MTGTLKARVGGAWVPILGSGQEAANTARWNSAWGDLGQARAGASSWTNATTTDTPITVTSGTASVTATFLPGRRYRVYWQGVMTSTVVGDLVVVFLSGMPVPVENVAARVQVAGQSVPLAFEAFFTVSTNTTTTIYPSGRRNVAGSGTVSAPMSEQTPMLLAVSDVGPITPASIAPPTAGPRVVASGNALGIVAVGSLVSGSPLTLTANVVTQVTSTVNYTMAVGRRYRIVLAVRGIQSLSTATYVQSFLRDGTTNTPSASGPLWVSPQTTYGSIYYGWNFDGDGVNRNWNAILLSVNIGSNAYTADQGYFYVEDVGPNMSPALPIPTTYQSWTPLPLINGWTSAGSDRAPAYRKVGDMVQFRGLATGPGTSPQFAQLPVGFRTPLYDQCFAVYTDQGARQAEVLSTGLCSMNQGGLAYVFLDPVYFSTTP